MISDGVWTAILLGTLAVLLVGAVFEYRAIKNGPASQDAFTHYLRRVFRVDTKVGAFAFLAALGAFAFLLLWLSAHIIVRPI